VTIAAIFNAASRAVMCGLEMSEPSTGMNPQPRARILGALAVSLESSDPDELGG
jgi:hypothetical protein